MANLPGHHYIGPGNPLNNGLPVDLDDAIAQIHDHRYAHAQSEQDIHSADNEAIGEFLADVANPHSALGALGLGAKSLGEHIAGKVIYPNMSKRTRTETQIEPDVSSSGTGETLPQAGGSVAGGTGSSIGTSNVLSDDPSGDFNMTYTNCFQVYTGAFQFASNKPALKAGYGIENKVNNYVSTPLSVIDPNDMLYYMSRSEFFQLVDGPSKPYIWATHAEIEVTPLGYRLPFATNEAASGYANSQTLVQIATGVGLERHFAVFLNGYNNNDADPTTIESYNDNWTAGSMIYGTSSDLGAALGIPRHHNRYATIYYDGHKKFSEYSENPRLMKYIDITNVNDVKGGAVIKYSYDFKSAPLVMPHRLDIYTTTGNVRNMGMHRGAHPTTIDGTSLDIMMDGIASDQNAYTFNWDKYELPIEKSPYMSHFTTQDLSAKCPPLIYFGCMPIQSNAPLANKATFSPGVVVWKIKTKLHVRGSYKNTGGVVPSMMALDPIINTNFLNYLEYDHRLFFAGERVIRKSDRKLQPGKDEKMDTDPITPPTKQPPKTVIKKLFK